MFKIDAKKYSKTPEPNEQNKGKYYPKVSVLYDFRSESEKSIKNLIFHNSLASVSPKRTEELNEISKIKQKLADKKVPITSKCLNDGLSLYREMELSDPKVFPKGGELLLKSLIPEKIIEKLSVRKKRKRLRN